MFGLRDAEILLPYVAEQVMPSVPSLSRMIA